MISPVKLFKSRSYVEEIVSSIKGITMKNWKTTAAGIVIAALTLAKIWAPAEYQTNLNQTLTILASLFTALGLIAAKDSTTHSTVDQVEAASTKQSVGQ